jgi:tetratricopeptide (TPR) repeat protein
MRERILFLFIASLLLTVGASAHAASFKEWRNSIKAANDARLKGDFQKARQILETAGPDASRHGPDSFAENSSLLATVLIDTSESGQALQVINAALQRMGNPSKRESTLWKGILFAMRGLALKELKDYDNALANAESARLFIGAAAGQMHPELSNVHFLIGEIARAKKEYVKAEAAYRAGLDIAETRQSRTEYKGGWYTRYISDYSSSGILLNTSGLGLVCTLQKRDKDAEEYFNKGLKFAEKEYGPDHPALVIPLSGRAALFFKAKRRADFEKDTERIYRFGQKGPGIKHEAVFPLWLKFQWELDEDNRLAAAETADRIAAVFAVQNYGTKSMALDAIKTAAQGDNMSRTRAVLAQEMIRKAALKKFADTPEMVGPLLAEFALDAERAKEIGLARFNYELLLKLQETARDTTLYTATAEKIAETWIAQNKPAEALPYLQKVTARLRDKYGDDSRVAFAMQEEAALLKKMGQADAAREIEARAGAIHAKVMLKR